MRPAWGGRGCRKLARWLRPLFGWLIGSRAGLGGGGCGPIRVGEANQEWGMARGKGHGKLTGWPHPLIRPLPWPAVGVIATGHSAVYIYIDCLRTGCERRAEEKRKENFQEKPCT